MLKSERGSITVYVLTVVLFFSIILMAIFVSANNAIKNQKIADTMIIEKYEKEVDLAEEIYNEKIEDFKDQDYSEYVTVRWKNIDEGNLTANAEIEFKNGGENAVENIKYLENNTIKKLGIESEEWNSERNSGKLT